MINFSKVKNVSIPEGNVKEITSGDTLLWKGGYTNLVPTSIDTDGSIYNGVGYIEGYRLNSSGGMREASGSAATGFMPATGGDVVRIGGCRWYDTSSALNYLCAYDADFNYIGAATSMNGGGYYGTKPWSSIIGNENMVEITLANISGIAYIRVSCINTNNPVKGSDMIVTVNEEIE